MTSISGAPIVDRIWFPLLWDLSGRCVVVVGAGRAAEEKIDLLLAAKADVVVVAATASPGVQELAETGRIRWVRRSFRREDLGVALLAIAATDDTIENERVREAAEAQRIPVNAVDDPPNCTVIFPAVHRDGPLVVAISTAGAAPAVAVRLRDEIRNLTKGYGPWLRVLAGFRSQISERFQTFAERRAVWYDIADDRDTLLAVTDERHGEAIERVQRIVDEHALGPAGERR